MQEVKLSLPMWDTSSDRSIQASMCSESGTYPGTFNYHRYTWKLNLGKLDIELPPLLSIHQHYDEREEEKYIIREIIAFLDPRMWEPK